MVRVTRSYVFCVFFFKKKLEPRADSYTFAVLFIYIYLKHHIMFSPFFIPTSGYVSTPPQPAPSWTGAVFHYLRALVVGVAVAAVVTFAAQWNCASIAIAVIAADRWSARRMRDALRNARFEASRAKQE
jgi:hypothetical protein